MLSPAEKRKQVLENLRDAIQQAEEFGLVRTETGGVITGVIESDSGFTLVKE